ncbi:type II toxin-antitoxin system PemK/MazF family toxin [Mesobacillus jeotgali]|uniref:type II toxin-antitoxin system PemK/MazF family toxin n=1 Tax=Mesobacillus jeotgali TaxID=129985 RepID=UPI0009A690A4|nr:type II toxin-antitoxin system PemK/MazF family toxin [Mesobacillus jeotgali]
MDYKTFTQTIDSLSSKDFQDLNNILKEFNELNDFLASLSTVDRAIILKKIKLFAEKDASIVHFDSSKQKFVPDYQKMDIVHCDFTGVGFEWDGPHYAVIWDINPKLDSVMVIPTTSQKRKGDLAGIIPVGTISGLNNGTKQKSTTLLVTDMTRVSRKRLSKVTFNHPKKGVIPVRLPFAWVKRIQEAIAVTYGDEITFEEFLLNNCGVDMVNEIKVLNTWRFKPIKGNYNSATKVLSIREWNSDSIYTFELVSPKKPFTKESKKVLVRNLWSDDPGVKASALADYADLY